MNPYQRKTPSEWLWKDGTMTRSVRYFPETDALIWSGWRESDNGPVFDVGYRQTRNAFLEKGISRLTPPGGLVNELRHYLQTLDNNDSRNSVLSFLRRGR